MIIRKNNTANPFKNIILTSAEVGYDKGLSIKVASQDTLNNVSINSGGGQYFETLTINSGKVYALTNYTNVDVIVIKILNGNNSIQNTIYLRKAQTIIFYPNFELIPIVFNNNAELNYSLTSFPSKFIFTDLDLLIDINSEKFVAINQNEVIYLTNKNSIDEILRVEIDLTMSGYTFNQNNILFSPNEYISLTSKCTYTITRLSGNIFNITHEIMK